MGTFTNHKAYTFREEMTAPGLPAARLAQTLTPKGGERGSGCVESLWSEGVTTHPPLCRGAQLWGPSPREKQRGIMAHQRPPKRGLQTLHQTTKDTADPQCCKGQCETGPCKGYTKAFPPAQMYINPWNSILIGEALCSCSDGEPSTPRRADGEE